MAEHFASLSGFPYEGARSGAFDFKTQFSPRLERARESAHLLHAGQTDKTGQPYSQHLDAVQQGTALLGCGIEAQIAALFHDAVEDGHITLEALRDSYGEEIADIVDALTKRKGETNAQYLVRIRETGPDACRVKVADLLHNTRHDRVAALRAMGEPWEDTERRLSRYRRSLTYLLTQLGLIA